MGITDKYQPSEGELEILQILWERGPSTVREVHEGLIQTKQVRYTTTLKQMQRMSEKGTLTRSGTGKSHIYHPAIPEEKVKKTMFKRFLNTAFKGSAMDLVIHALGQAKASPEEIEQLQEWLEEKKKGDES